jgi:hypothetical protein
VAARMQRKSVKQPNGRTRYSGEIVRRKGDVYNVDYAVTGSSPGTPDDPKCPLLPIFCDTMERTTKLESGLRIICSSLPDRRQNYPSKGNNKFIGSGGSIHCGIGNDFKFTENGIERKD